MTSPSIHELEKQIEQLVRAHMAACREAATAAVQRAFAAAEAPRPRSSKRRKRSSRALGTGRRSRAQMAALRERLYELVVAHPGETMTVLAPMIGETPASLERPMKHLRSAERVRSAGQRQHTCYFPLTAPAAE